MRTQSEINEEVLNASSAIAAMTQDEVSAGLQQYGLQPLKKLPPELKSMIAVTRSRAPATAPAAQRFMGFLAALRLRTTDVLLRRSPSTYVELSALTHSVSHQRTRAEIRRHERIIPASALLGMFILFVGVFVVINTTLRNYLEAVAQNEKSRQELHAENEKLRQELAAMQTLTIDKRLDHLSLVWPVEGSRQVVFSGDSDRGGIDIPVEGPAQVRAVSNGAVIVARPSEGLLVIDHGDGITTSYAHLANISVREGQSVVRGQFIGRVSQASDRGAHLHYQIKINNEPVDLNPYLVQLKLEPGRE